MVNSITRVIIDNDPYRDSFNIDTRPANQAGYWPASWLEFPDDCPDQVVVYFKLEFKLAASQKIRMHVSADERYRLFLDGELISMGPSRGDPANWYFKTYDLALPAGKHVFVSQVWRLGDLAPIAQISGINGFLLASEGSFAQMLNTGLAPWKVKQAEGYSFRANEIAWGPCFDTIIDGSEFDWSFEKSDKTAGWTNASVGDYGKSGLCFGDYVVHKKLLCPDPLPDMLYNEVTVGKVRHVDIVNSHPTWQQEVLKENNICEWQQKFQSMIFQGRSAVIGPNKSIRVIIDLENYYCAYPVIKTNGGVNTRIRISWVESLFEQPRYTHIDNPKGNRNEIDGKYFVAIGDEFILDGGENRNFEPLWWRAGRYVELLIETFDSSVTIESFKLRETRYPLEMETQLVCEDERINETIPIMVRSMQMCCHETFMDCPYYEQLMYAGDTRLELLTMYAMSSDNYLPRKIIKTFASSLMPSGLLQSRYPARIEQIIPPFCLWWIGMVYDYTLWRGDKEFVASLRPQMHCVLDTFLKHIDNNKQLLVSFNGWNFVDWVPSWQEGVPPQAMPGQISSILNLQLVLGLEYASQIEKYAGDTILADYYNSKAVALLNEIMNNFWCEQNSLLADDLNKLSFSEHAQVLAILSNNINLAQANNLGRILFGRDDLSQTTIYFNHYYFEACHKLKNKQAFFKRLKLWLSLKEHGFKTTFETPGHTRSDCHAWGAHPIYHLFKMYKSRVMKNIN